MKFLSLFAGIGGFELGIRDAFPDAECVGFSESDPYPLGVYRRHFPNHPCLGPVEGVGGVGPYDLLVAGFPCTDLSIANVENLGLEGGRSGLLYEVVRILGEYRPGWFVVENVASMKKGNRDAITSLLGVEPVLLNAADVSAQHRERLFWANFPVAPLPAAGVEFSSVLDAAYDPRLVLSERELGYMNRRVSGGRNHWDFGHHHDTAASRSRCLPANLHKGVPYNVVVDRRFGGAVCRKLSPGEAERLMGFPTGWTDGVSSSRRYKAVGNAVSVPVVSHVFRCLRTHLGGGDG